MLQGQSNYYWARQAAKWGADFMATATEKDRVILHIGDIKADHAYMGRAEDYPQIDRNLLWCDSGAVPKFLSLLLRCWGPACSTIGCTPLADYLQHKGCLKRALLWRSDRCWWQGDAHSTAMRCR